MTQIQSHTDTMNTKAVTDDPFDELLNLEEQYYNEGHALGVADGQQAGRIEGRTFGLEKGFEKYVAMGMLAGQCAVWQGRSDARSADSCLPRLDPNGRLGKQLHLLSALVDIDTLSHDNTEDAVAEFDDRLKAARGKAKVITNMVGESKAASLLNDTATTKTAPRDRSNIEDFLSASKAVI